VVVKVEDTAHLARIAAEPLREREVAVAMDRYGRLPATVADGDVSPLARLLMISTPAAFYLRISCRPFMASL